MMKSQQIMTRVVRLVSISLFVLFVMLCILFGNLLVSGQLVLSFVYLFCFCLVCCGAVLSGVLVGMLLREMHSELVGQAGKEAAVRSYYRYHELRTNSRIDN